MSFVDFEQSYPPSLWTAPVVPATTGVAGELGDGGGTWLPAGSTPPTADGLLAGDPVTVTASPTTAWTGTQVVFTSDDQPASWSGTAWTILPFLAMTVAQVEAWVTDHPEDAALALAVEQARRSPRSTLVAWLQSHQEVP